MSEQTVKRQKAAGEKGKFGELGRDTPTDLTLPPQDEYEYDDTYLRVHEFPASMLTVAEAAIEKANHRAERAGITERFTYEIERFERKSKTEAGLTKIEERVRLTLNRPSLAHDDWQFVGKVSWDPEAGAIVHTADGVTLHERPSRATCDVCGQSRTRNDTFIIERDGEQMQVGGDCVKRFFGIRPAGLWMLDFDLEIPSEHDPSSAPRDAYRTDRIETMAVAVAAVNAAGWVSRANASPSNPATAELVAETLFGRHPETDAAKERKRKALAAEITGGIEEAKATAAKVIEFVTDPANNDGSEYFENLAAVVGAESVSRKNLGIFVSAVSAYQRAEAKKIAAAAHASSKHIGKPGEKIADHKVKVTSVRPLANAYGITTLVEMIDEDGNVLKWFASGDKPFKAGDSYTLAATIKDHDSYDGVNQTLVTRAKLLDPNT